MTPAGLRPTVCPTRAEAGVALESNYYTIKIEQVEREFSKRARVIGEELLPEGFEVVLGVHRGRG